MKNSKASFYLIGVIFILLVGMAMTGCAQTLHDAVQKSDIIAVKSLLNQGADVNAKGELGMTALIVAARSGHTDIVEFLIEKGADVNIETNKGATALSVAAISGHVNIVKLLIEKGAHVNAKGQGSMAALSSAVVGGHVNIVKLLIEKGAHVNAKGQGSMTALHFASMRGRVNIVKLLIEKGADVNAKDSDDRSVLWSAAYWGHPDTVQLLIEKGANIDVVLAKLEVDTIKYPHDDKGKVGFKLLEKFAKKQEIASQPVIAAAKPSPEVSPFIKSDVDELPSIKAKPKKNSYAIVIGIEEYRQKLPKADFAVSDAKLVSEYLSTVMGYPEENIVVLTNEHASKSDFEKYFEQWLSNNVERGGSVFIYYSGHGAPNPKTGDAYLVPYDGDPSFIDKTGYSLNRMYDALGKLPAKEIIVALDSCFSGAGGRSVLAEGARPLVMNIQNVPVSAGNMTIMAAAAGNQISSTYKEKGHGLFTYFMLKGIKNEEVVKEDGSIALSDLFSYLKPQVERIARKQYNNEQTPQLIGAKKN